MSTAELKLNGTTIISESGGTATIQNTALSSNVDMSNANLSNVDLSNTTFPSGFPIKVTHFQDTNTQAVYGTVGYNYYNDTYTTNANQNSKLLIQYGVFYEMNGSSDQLQMAVSLDGTDVGVWNDTQGAAEYNIWTTAQTITSELTKNTGYTIRLYIKGRTGNVVIPRNGASPNWTLTITEIAV